MVLVYSLVIQQHISVFKIAILIQVVSAFDIDIEVDGSKTVSEAHAISHRVEKKIKESINNIYDIVIHIEPYGDIDKDEKFGVSDRNINKKR